MQQSLIPSVLLYIFSCWLLGSTYTILSLLFFLAYAVYKLYKENQ